MSAPPPRGPVAIVRRPSRSLAACELTFVERHPIDAERAAAEHAAYRAAIEAAGARVLCLDALEEHPDAVFVEDPAVVLDEVAVVARMGAASRAGEVATVEAALAALHPVVPLGAGRLEGGDVLRVGRTLWVGLSARTDADGARALAAIAEPLGYRVVPVPVRGCLHLKTAVTAADDETIVLNPAWVDPEPWAGMRVVPVAPEEPFAANVLRVGGAVITAAGAPRTEERLHAAGVSLTTVDLRELQKAEAGPTCLSLIIRQVGQGPAPGA